MQNDGQTTLAERTQCYADMGDMDTFYEAFESVCGPSHQFWALYAFQMELEVFSNKQISHQSILKALFSDQLTMQESPLAKILQVDEKLDLDNTMKKTTTQLKAGKFPCIDGIPAEVC